MASSQRVVVIMGSYLRGSSVVGTCLGASCLKGSSPDTNPDPNVNFKP